MDDEARRTAERVAGDGGLAGLRRLTETIIAAEALRTRIIDDLRGHGFAGWDEIGRACGMTGQSAVRRWSKPLHATSFGAAADVYERGRPGYPPEAIAWLVPGDARRVLDLGAGTGKLTRQLAGAGFDVVAVEPLEEMRGRLREAAPGVSVREGSAERVPLPDGSVDAVVAAQAWHWFDPARAVPEVARVLAPGGTLSLVWNLRDLSEPWVFVLDQILHQHSRQVIDTRPPVGRPFGAPEHAEFRWRQPMPREGLVDLVASRSYVISLADADRRRLLDEVAELLDTHPDLKGRDEITVPYVTHCTRLRSERVL
ncbi:Methyltransferase domain-containing protein [Nonomuraea maritima]|uniref:Methyltransferase domain-containing protein n=1 Tax=Nonomuraea maritima TaxID=683260 RepID=A0A1G9GIP8_9ACTN|nr:class I SAM-dependent methyltransferase [Nonomuraea maritima]SDL00554.1 Methyltransferase domain-containing protein [Nonomuraea maritima]